MTKKIGFLILAVWLSAQPIYSQDQSKADSLFSVWQSLDSSDASYLPVLYDLSYYESDPARVIDYAEQIVRIAQHQQNVRYQVLGAMSQGQAHLVQSNFEEALRSFFPGLELAIANDMSREAGQLQSSIADTYVNSGNFDNGFTYYKRAIANLEKVKDTISIATLLINLGDAHFSNGDISEAGDYFTQSLTLFETLNNEEGTAFNLGNLGMVYAEQGKHLQAEDHLNRAIEIFERRQSFYPISVFLTYIADIYLHNGDTPQAIKVTLRSLDLAQEHGLKSEISQAHLKLSEIYEASDDESKAFYHYRQHITIRDSVNNIETVEALANERTEFEVSQKQAELDLVEQQRKTQKAYSTAAFVGLGLLSLLAIVLYRSNRIIKRSNQIIAQEKERSEELLLNILPHAVAEELKRKGKVKARKYDSVSVLFADFVGFTSYSQHLSPEDVVQTIDEYFTAFDKIITKNGLEKIKTLGDGYMCASGLPVESTDHAVSVVGTALEMIEYVHHKTQNMNEELALDIRIGIHSGPVVAGVVGLKKFAYDIWGDTVNTASRIESHSIPGRVNISESTYQQISSQYVCEARAPQEVKGKGSLQMYFVSHPKTQS